MMHSNCLLLSLNGAPFKDWDLPTPLAQVRAKLKSHAGGDRQFVKVLGAVLDHGLAAVEAACAKALEAGIASGEVILTVLAHQRQPAPPPSITTPDALRLKIEPTADCGRYDSIRKSPDGTSRDSGCHERAQTRWYAHHGRARCRGAPVLPRCC
jgi:hypothetical protein